MERMDVEERESYFEKLRVRRELMFLEEELRYHKILARRKALMKSREQVKRVRKMVHRDVRTLFNRNKRLIGKLSFNH